MTFNDLAEEEYQKARAEHRDIASPHEGYAVLLEEVDEVKEEVWKKKPNLDAMLKELAQVAAVARKFGEDCVLWTSRKDASGN